MQTPDTSEEHLVHDLNEIQIYYVLTNIRSGKVPAAYATDGKQQGRSSVEFSFSAWSSFYRYFKEPAFNGNHTEPAWQDFCKAVELLEHEHREHSIEEAVAAVLRLLTDQIGYAPSMVPGDPGPFGCFRYVYDEKDKYVATHFNNIFAPDSPFNHHKELLESLQAIITDIAEKGLQPERIGCDSWMDNLPAFQALWPASFTASLTPTSPDNKGGYGWWGQFLDRTGAVGARRAARFKETLEFRYHRMHGESPYKEFCTFVAKQSQQ